MTYQLDVTQAARSLARDPSGSTPITEQLRLSLESAQSVLLRNAQRSVTDAIWKLGTRSFNWDGYGSEAPNPDSIRRAVAFAEFFVSGFRAINLEWIDPHAGLDESGHVVLEWWRGSRKLTLYIQPDNFEYITSWGPDIDNQMESGSLDAVGSFVRLWQWLQAPVDE